MRPETTMVAKAVRERLAAVAHSDAYPNSRRAATRNGVSERTVRRWCSIAEAQGSPLDRQARYVACAEDPWRIVAHDEAIAVQQTVKKWDNERLIREYRLVRLRDKANEASDTANSLEEVAWEEEAAGSERDAADDLMKAAICRELAERKIERAEVMR
jgi:hypothetical protein